MVEVVQARTQLRKAARASPGSARSTTSGRRASRSTRRTSSTTASAAAPGATSSGFVRETEQLDFAQAVEWLAERFRVTLEYEESSPGARRRPQPARAAARAAGAGDELLRTLSLGLGCRPARAGVPREPGPRRGGVPRIPARARARRVDARPEGPREGLHRGRARRGGPRQPARERLLRGRLLFPLADPRGRVRGFQARRLREDDPLRAKYVNSPEGELFRKGELLYGLDRARHGDGEAGARDRGRGEHRRARIAAGGARAGRCLDGNGAHGASTEGAHAPDAQGLSLLRRRRGRERQRRCGGWSSRPHRTSTCAWSRCRPGSTRPTRRRASRNGSPAPRAISSTAFGWRPSARPTGRRRSSASARCCRVFEDSPERQDASGSPPTGSTCRPRPSPASRPSRRAATGRCRRGCSRRESGSSATPWPGCAAHPGLLPVLAELGPEHFDASCTARARAHLARGGRPARGARPAAGRARRTGRDRGNRRGDRQGAAPPPARAQVRRELAGADLERTKELQEQLEATREPRSLGVRPVSENHPCVLKCVDTRLRDFAAIAAEHRSPVAQLAEHPAVNRRVVGSSPTRGAAESPRKRGFCSSRGADGPPDFLPTFYQCGVVAR